ncbi:ABC transporter ATP-binding protein [mine drainage metagenome]|uniref:ABC transporter ATP-binding protein n=1 Tax=mine drainage metagenome TaxID=410659 RepID=T1APE3_9ZZZZ
MGPSGSGKSTLLNLIGGVDTPTAGEVWVGETPLHRYSEAALTHWRATHVGFVFQLYHLLPILSAYGNTELPLLSLGISRSNRRRKTAAALTLAGLPERFWKFKPTELSGGQQQRVGIARAFVTDPELLICDEPTGDLDRSSRDEILELLTEVNEHYGKTIIMATHDPHAAGYATRIVHLERGCVRPAVEQGGFNSEVQLR